MDTKEVYDDRKSGISNSGKTKTLFRVHPCYEDVNDKSTLQFWIIHY